MSFINRYFLDELRCSSDIAHRLTQLVSYGARLPTGSPASPIMSFLAYRPMFEELHELALSMDLTMTVYVDDVVVSGPRLASRFIAPARAIIARYGLSAHKFSTTCAGLPSVITGLQQTATGEAVPPARFRKIRALETELRRTTDPVHKAVLLKGLIGQYREGMGLIPNALSHANRYQREFDGLPSEVRLKSSKRRNRKAKAKAKGTGGHGRRMVGLRLAPRQTDSSNDTRLCGRRPVLFQGHRRWHPVIGAVPAWKRLSTCRSGSLQLPWSVLARRGGTSALF